MRRCVVLVVLLALTGCHDQQDHPTARPSATVSPAPSPSSSIVAAAEGISFALVSADQRTVTVTALGGGCTVDARLTAHLTADAANLGLTSYTRESPGGGCTANLIIWARSTVLSSPLGDRPLRDASTGKRIPSFDGRRLAHVGWLPPGARPPTDRPDGRGWSRTFDFPVRTTAPLEIEQITGDHLDERLPPNPAFHVMRAMVHGRAARVLTQRDDAGRLVQTRVGWTEGGYTFVVQSSPEWVWQRPFEPSVCLHVARELQL